MSGIISAPSGHEQFTVGFLDTRQRHFGAYNSGMLPSHGAADIATRVVQQHQADQNTFAALTAFVTDVKQHAEPGSAGAAAGPASHTLRNVLIVLGIIAVITPLGLFVIWRPIRKRRQRELGDAKVAAQDDRASHDPGTGPAPHKLARPSLRRRARLHPVTMTPSPRGHGH